MRGHGLKPIPGLRSDFCDPIGNKILVVDLKNELQV